MFRSRRGGKKEIDEHTNRPKTSRNFTLFLEARDIQSMQFLAVYKRRDTIQKEEGRGGEEKKQQEEREEERREIRSYLIVPKRTCEVAKALIRDLQEEEE